jgi:hypothetical protein
MTGVLEFEVLSAQAGSALHLRLKTARRTLCGVHPATWQLWRVVAGDELRTYIWSVQRSDNVPACGRCWDAALRQLELEVPA